MYVQRNGAIVCIQGDPGDGLLYTIKGGTANLVLLGLPHSKASRKSGQNRAAKKSVPRAAADPAAAAADMVTEELLGTTAQARSPQWNEISKAVGQHCFRMPGEQSVEISAVWLA